MAAVIGRQSTYSATSITKGLYLHELPPGETMTSNVNSPGQPEDSFYRVPKDFFARTDLSVYEKPILIYFMNNRSDFIYAPARLVSKLTGVNQRTCEKVIPGLIEKGFLVVAGPKKKGVVPLMINNEAIFLTAPQRSTHYAHSVVPLRSQRSAPCIEDKNNDKNNNNGCNDPTSHRPPKQNIVSEAKALEPFFFEPGNRDRKDYRLNFNKFNARVAEMMSSHGPDAGEKMQAWFLAERNGKPLPLHTRNWEILMNEIFTPTTTGDRHG